MKREEKKLYSPIGTMLKDQGYEKVIIDDFSVQPYSGSRGRRLDVIAARWRGDDLDTVAVECKKTPPPDGIIEALPQAIDTMLFVDKTYVATPAGEDLRGLKLLDKLGIGYIAIRDGKALTVHQPDPLRLSLKDQEKYVEQVRSRIKTLMIFKEFASGKRVRSGGTRVHGCWAAIDIVRALEIQHNVWLNEEDEYFHSGVNFEKRKPVLKVAKGLRAGTLTEFSKALRNLPSTYSIMVKEHRGIGKKERPVLSKPAKDFSVARTRALVTKLKSIERKAGSRMEVAIHRPLWATIEDIPREEGRRRLIQVSEEIAPIIEMLDSAAR